MDCPGQYDKFLHVLTEARKQSWRPGKVRLRRAPLGSADLCMSVCLLAGTDIPENRCSPARLAPSDEAVH